jgi:hypothetical protein
MKDKQKKNATMDYFDSLIGLTLVGHAYEKHPNGSGTQRLYFGKSIRSKNGPS